MGGATIATVDQLGDVAAKTKAATADVLAAAARAGHVVTQVWGAGGGDHADGYASDFMVYADRAMGDWIADYVWANRARLGVRWEIWFQRIRSTSPGKPGTWVPMEDRGSPTQNHLDHVHVKWTVDPITQEGTTVTPAEIQAVADAVWDRLVYRTEGKISALQELADAKTYARQTVSHVAALEAAVAELAAAGSTVTADDVRAASAEGARQALEALVEGHVAVDVTLGGPSA